MGEEIDGAIQQAPQLDRHSMNRQFFDELNLEKMSDMKVFRP